jgi:hypothetical protein
VLFWAGFMLFALLAVSWTYYFAPVPTHYHFYPYVSFAAGLLSQKFAIEFVDWNAALVSFIMITLLHLTVYWTTYR